MFLSILLASACSAVPAQKTASTSVTTASDPFPAATAGIQIAAEGAETKLPKLLEEFSRVTGVTLLMDPETRSDVSKSGTGLNRNVDVPAAEVYPVVETILLQNGFALQPLHDREPRIASLVSTMRPNRGGLVTQALAVSTGDLEFYSRHPAVLVTTVVELSHTDVRTLSNSMRTMFTDANTQQIIPVGNTNSLILTGFGRTIGGLVRMLQAADEASARAIAEEEKRVEHAQAPPQQPTPKKDEKGKDEKPKQ